MLFYSNYYELYFKLFIKRNKQINLERHYSNCIIFNYGKIIICGLLLLIVLFHNSFDRGSSTIICFILFCFINQLKLGIMKQK